MYIHTISYIYVYTFIYIYIYTIFHIHIYIYYILNLYIFFNTFFYNFFVLILEWLGAALLVPTKKKPREPGKAPVVSDAR